MKIPTLDEPQRYQGLYVYDFGEWTAVGYTADEIAVLLESEQYRGGKVYRIVRISPDGQFELKGVSAERFQAESGTFFNRDDRATAEADFEHLRALGQEGSLPCRAVLHLADRGELEGVYRYVTALIYPAEYDEDVARWLIDRQYAGGDLAEGGISHVSNYYAQEKTVLAQEQLWSQSAQPSRMPDEIFATVREAVQR